MAQRLVNTFLLCAFANFFHHRVAKPF